MFELIAQDRSHQNLPETEEEEKKSQNKPGVPSLGWEKPCLSGV